MRTIARSLDRKVAPEQRAVVAGAEPAEPAQRPADGSDGAPDATLRERLLVRQREARRSQRSCQRRDVLADLLRNALPVGVCALAAGRVHEREINLLEI